MSKQIALPDDLGPRARQVIELVFANPKISNKEIAEQLGISGPRVSQIRNHPKFVACFPEMARRKVKSLIPKAMGKVEALLDQTANLEVSRKVMESVLASQKVLENQPTTQINVFQNMSVDDLKRKVDEISDMSAHVVDSSVVEDTDTPHP